MDKYDVTTPLELKRLNISELDTVANRIRERIISVVEKNGGHLSSNLGSVELTIALHYVFDCPNDKLVFDVGHQAYAHKILTDRSKMFDTLRQNGGISGFPKPSESEYDAFTSGHASTSLSVALGLAEAARQKKEDRKIVAVIGDGALTGGLAFEALNAIGSEGLPVIIVLNDNEMSISKNVGAMSKYLTRLRVSRKYARFKGEIRRAVSVIPFFGDGTIRLMEKGKNLLKRIVLSNKMFEEMGINYCGPFDGHDIGELVEVFTQIKQKNVPTIIHVITNKGQGLPSAIDDPAHSHGISASSVENEKAFAPVLCDFLSNAAKKDERVMAVTAAMAIGTGLESFSEKYPSRFKDVGIAEEHAVTYCSALAAGGMKPYFAVYSTFLQRGFDEILHDTCIGNYPVTYCIDRAGVVGSDGVTHQGVFDLSYLSMLPNMTIMCPTDGVELNDMLEFSLGYNAPLAIRYPKSYLAVRKHLPIEYGKWEVLKEGNSNVYLLCVGGRTVDVAEKVAETLNATIVNCRFVKPLDYEYLDKINKRGNIIITIEDNVKRGGFGESVISYMLQNKLLAKTSILAYPDEFIDDRDLNTSFAKGGITAENIINVVKSLE